MCDLRFINGIKIVTTLICKIPPDLPFQREVYAPSA
jgi:hypothetical protein